MTARGIFHALSRSPEGLCCPHRLPTLLGKLRISHISSTSKLDRHFLNISYHLAELCTDTDMHTGIRKQVAARKGAQEREGSQLLWESECRIRAVSQITPSPLHTPQTVVSVSVDYTFGLQLSNLLCGSWHTFSLCATSTTIGVPCLYWC